MKNETTTPRWEDVVFENRNKEYGAYVIRLLYSDNMVKASLITAALMLTMISYPTIAALLASGTEAHTIIIEPPLTLGDPPSIRKDPPPVPKYDVPPPVKTVVKFVAPTITDKVVEEDKEVLKIDDLPVVAISDADADSDAKVIFTEPVKEAITEEDYSKKTFLTVEQAPEFPGGMEALYKFLYGHIQYPAQARRIGVEGTVFVTFVVAADGKVVETELVKGIGAGCDEMTLRAVNMLPNWKPGKQRGVPVRVKFTLPLKYKLQ